jgi:phosphatidylglycerophosphatase A
MSNPSPFADKRGRSLKISGPLDVIALIVATGLGVGFIPFGPGAWGSAVGLLLVYGAIEKYGSNVLLLQNLIIGLSIVLAVIGIWAGARAEKILDRKDAGQVVIDEICGQVMSFAFLAPYLARLGSHWRWWMVVGFVLFRLFDMFKPYPINKLQDLQGGFGIMMDDVLAGLYAAAALSLLLIMAI